LTRWKKAFHVSFFLQKIYDFSLKNIESFFDKVEGLQEVEQIQEELEFKSSDLVTKVVIQTFEEEQEQEDAKEEQENNDFKEEEQKQQEQATTKKTPNVSKNPKPAPKSTKVITFFFFLFIFHY